MSNDNENSGTTPIPEKPLVPQFPTGRVELDEIPEMPRFPIDRIEKGEKPEDISRRDD